MKSCIFIFSILFLFLDVNAITITTKIGQVIGTQLDTMFFGENGTVNMFRGIPYAEPPTGTLRFRKPVPKRTYLNPINATEFGPGCPQDRFMMMGWVPGFPDLAEDCLTLNVFVPVSKSDQSNKSYAVMVWIYGGAYVIGQSKMYSAENLTMVGDVIVVTLNYRITSLGFLRTGSDKYPGNLGLWDQQLAFQWIHDNIADFGGDPNRVTIFGESAGGASVLYQSLYPGNRGLFQRLIAESGSPLCPWAYQPYPEKYARMLADTLGCTDHNLDSAVDCLQGLDVWTVVNNSRIGSQEETTFRAEWVPSMDRDMITRKQSDLFQTGTELFSDLDIMIGMNNNDGAFVSLLAVQPFQTQHLNATWDSGIPRDFFESFYIPLYIKDMNISDNKTLQDLILHTYTDWRDPTNDDYMRSKFLEFVGDYNFFMPLISNIRTHAQISTRAKSFMYEFKLRPTFNSSPKWVEGANHGEELPFVFGFPDTMANGMHFYQLNVPDYEKQISKNMMIMWSNFAKTGDPNRPVKVPQSTVWPEYTLDTKKYLQITASGTSVSKNLFGERTNFWLSLSRHVTGNQIQIVG